MLANQLISNSILPVHIDDTGEAVLVIMGLFHVRHLPIVEGDKLIGIISEDDIYTQDVNLPISAYPHHASMISVLPEDHLFEVMGTMSSNKLSMIPVVNGQNKYLGIISQSDLLQFYANSFSFAEPGSILLLEVPRIDYSLEEICRIIEGENAVVLSSFLSEDSSNHDIILVTVKLNKLEVSDVILALERHEYIVRNAFSEEEFIDKISDNYDHLMRYLNV